MPAYFPTAQTAIVGDEGVEYPALLVSFGVREAALPAAGGSVSIIEAPLSDGSVRALVLYAIDPLQVSTMASNATTRAAIAESLQLSASQLP